MHRLKPKWRPSAEQAAITYVPRSGEGAFVGRDLYSGGSFAHDA